MDLSTKDGKMELVVWEISVITEDEVTASIGNLQS